MGFEAGRVLSVTEPDVELDLECASDTVSYVGDGEVALGVGASLSPFLESTWK